MKFNLISETQSKFGILFMWPFAQPRSASYQNHVSFKSSESSFEVSLGSLSRMPESGFSEAQKAAFLIKNKHKDLVLCLSGGIDSEVMLQSFLAVGAKFSICFLRFRHGLNDFDILTNLKLVRKLALPFRIIELDVIAFFESGMHLIYADKYQCQSPQLAAHLWMLDQIDGTPVLSGNPIFPTFVDLHAIYFMGLPGMLHAVYFRYFEITGRSGIPWFLLYTPELSATFLNHTSVEASLQELWAPEKYDYLTKCRIYRDHGFKVAPRQDKFTGFERVRDFYDVVMGTNWGTGFDKAFRMPMELKNPAPVSYRQVVPVRYLNPRKRIGFDSTHPESQPVI